MNEKKIIEARKMLLKYVADVIAEKEITQEEIAYKSGFVQSHISRMLSGKFPPTLDNFLKICEATGVRFFIKNK